jgi:hypothetical protein
LNFCHYIDLPKLIALYLQTWKVIKNSFWSEESTVTEERTRKSTYPFSR